MQATHIILGRPWQFDRKVSWDGFTNKYSFSDCNKKIVLVPLTPQQVQKDQTSLQREFELELEKKKKQESEGNGKQNREEIKVETGRGKMERKKANSSSAIEVRNEGKQMVLVKAKTVRKALFSNQPLLSLFCKQVFVANQLDVSLPSSIANLLQEYQDVFPEDIPSGLH